MQMEAALADATRELESERERRRAAEARASAIAASAGPPATPTPYDGGSDVRRRTDAAERAAAREREAAAEHAAAAAAARAAAAEADRARAAAVADAELARGGERAALVRAVAAEEAAAAARREAARAVVVFEPPPPPVPPLAAATATPASLTDILASLTDAARVADRVASLEARLAATERDAADAVATAAAAAATVGAIQAALGAAAAVVAPAPLQDQAAVASARQAAPRAGRGRGRGRGRSTPAVLPPASPLRSGTASRSSSPPPAATDASADSPLAAVRAAFSAAEPGAAARAAAHTAARAVARQGVPVDAVLVAFEDAVLACAAPSVAEAGASAAPPLPQQLSATPRADAFRAAWLRRGAGGAMEGLLAVVAELRRAGARSQPGASDLAARAPRALHAAAAGGSGVLPHEAAAAAHAAARLAAAAGDEAAGRALLLDCVAMRVPPPRAQRGAADTPALARGGLAATAAVLLAWPGLLPAGGAGDALARCLGAALRDAATRAPRGGVDAAAGAALVEAGRAAWGWADPPPPGATRWCALEAAAERLAADLATAARSASPPPAWPSLAAAAALTARCLGPSWTDAALVQRCLLVDGAAPHARDLARSLAGLLAECWAGESAAAVLSTRVA